MVIIEDLTNLQIRNGLDVNEIKSIVKSTHSRTGLDSYPSSGSPSLRFYLSFRCVTSLCYFML